MNRVIAILTGLHVLAHGIFGCCNHGQTVTGHKSTACVCHHGDHAEHEPGDSDKHHDDDLAEPACDCLATDDESPASAPHHCIHASCHWLAADVAANQHDFGFQHLIALDGNSASLAYAHAFAEFWPDSACAPFSAPPLRLHLALGVLLI